MSGVNLKITIPLRGKTKLTVFQARQILRRKDLRAQLGLAPLKYNVRHSLAEQPIRAADLKTAQNNQAEVRQALALREHAKLTTVKLKDVLSAANTPEARRLLSTLPVEKPVNHDQLESDTKSVGDQLFTAMLEDREENPPSKIGKLFNKLLTDVMDNPAMQQAAFFFIEVFPCLKTSKEIVEHAQAYFKDVEMPAIFKMGLMAASVSTTIAAGTMKKGIEFIAKRFVIAETTDEALEKIAELDEQGFAVTADLLGEHTLSLEEAQVSTTRYTDKTKKIADKFDGRPKHSGLNPEISVKLSSISHLFDPIDQEGSYQAIKENLTKTFRTAKERGISATVDMEQYKVKDLTLTIIKRILEQDEFKDWDGAGIVIQAYLKDSEKDIRETIAWAKQRGVKLSIRLVKGAYHDMEIMWARQEEREIPVFERKCESDANFERCTDLLMKNHKFVRPNIATMNARSAAKAMVLAKKYNVGQADWEIQLLYGMNNHLAKAIHKISEKILGYKVRVRFYGPIGNLIQGMAYFIRRLIENTSQTSFLRQAFLEEKDRAALLEDPFEKMAVEDKTPLPDVEATHDAMGRPIFRRTPPLEWHKAATRAAFTKTVSQVQKNYDGSKKIGALIGGKDVFDKLGEAIESVNPSNNQVIAKVSTVTKETALQAVTQAKTSQKAWEELGGLGRAKKLRQAATIMLEKRLELAAIMCLEVGKNPREADNDVCEAIDFLNYYADQAEYFGDYETLQGFPGEHEQIRFVARGTTLTIGPWNFPLAIPTGMNSSNAASGNSLLWKPSSRSPVIGREMADIFNQAGIPIQFLPSGREIGDALVKHPDINTIVFTGSEAAGINIMKAAAEVAPGQQGPKKVAAEMGGKNGIIVDANADMDEAIAGIIYAAFGYQGQKCSACSRVIFVGTDEQYKTFTHRLTEAAKDFKIGPAHELGTFMGPVIDKAARNRIQGFFERAVAGGANILLDRKIDNNLSEQGSYIGPKIVDNVALDSELALEEVFGPLLAIFRAKDFDNALKVANDPRFGLTGAVYSRHPERIQKAIDNFGVGNLYINRGSTGALVCFQPFGAPGNNWSGTGAVAKPGAWGQILEYMGIRSVSTNMMRSGFTGNSESEVA